MIRLKRFVGTQFYPGCGCSDERLCDDTETAMSEIVKRFFRNEPIPEYNQNEVYDYEDETISHTVVHLDEDGNPIKDSKGNILSHETLKDDIISMIPIHPNIEDVDPYGDNSSLLQGLQDANNRLGAFQRVEAEAQKQKVEKANAEKIQYAESQGYSKQSDDVKAEE